MNTHLLPLKQEDMWALIQAVLGKDFPQIVYPLLHERNVHLARAVEALGAAGSKRVVAVVGKGHLPGLIHSLCIAPQQEQGQLPKP